MPDPYKATWISHSSISDFLKCPRLYYLRAVYKDPLTRQKISIISPPLALGQAVHDTIESLSTLPVEERLKTPLLKRFEKSWEKVAGKKGGFKSKSQEDEYKERGVQMLKKIEKNPGPILKKAIKIKADLNLPNYWLSSDEEIILCGKIDWLEYIENSDSVHIIDFKTNRRKEEKKNSLQLLIYHLLATNTQSRPVSKASFWYLELKNAPTKVSLPDLSTAHKKLLTIGKRIKLARSLEHFKCPKGDSGCAHCLPYEAILKGKGEKVSTSSYQDIYIL